MTGYLEANIERMLRNAEKVITVAKAAEITSVLFTGKGEPTLDKAWGDLVALLKRFNMFPCELQTNGIILAQRPNLVDELFVRGLDVLAVSIDRGIQLIEYKPLWNRLNTLGMVSRITVNVTNLLTEYNPIWWINQCNRLGIHQLTFRRVTVPESCVSFATQNWIFDNAPDYLYQNITAELENVAKTDGRLIRSLKNGIRIWDINGVAVATSDYCIQERDEGDNLRSLVFQEDGHLYTGWGSKASILF
jgi:hypothetical protein